MITRLQLQALFVNCLSVDDVVPSSSLLSRTLYNKHISTPCVIKMAVAPYLPPDIMNAVMGYPKSFTHVSP